MAKQVGKRAKPQKAKVKQWLKRRRHIAKRVDDEVDAKDIELAVVNLHGVTAAEYAAAKRGNG
jgi:hypothetical protein